MKETNLNININRDDSSINDFLIIFESMKVRPSRVIIHERFSGKEFNNIIKKYFSGEDLEQNFLTEYLPSDDEYIINEKILRQVSEDIWISYVEINKQSEDFIVNEVCIYYRSLEQQKKFENLVIDLSDCIIDYEDDTLNKINTLCISNSTIELDPIFIPEELNENIENKYSDSSLRKIDKLIKKIKKNEKGLTIFSGESGIGKTNACKYVASKVDRMSIFIPNNMIDHTINNPDFKTFLKRFDKTLIVIDDCEFLYNSYNKNNLFTNNILQLIDGFHSDSMKIHFLLVFNVDFEEIDENLIECNNLIESIEFDFLDSEKANELCKTLNINKKFKEDVKLIDIFSQYKKRSKQKLGL